MTRKRRKDDGKPRAAKPTPNELAEPQTAEQTAALLVTCRYYGKIFYEGDKVCHEGQLWVCGADGWSDMDEAC
jgi:hypothetical protein